MNTASKLVMLALLGCACGPGRLGNDSSGESSTDDSTTSTSSSSETSTAETSTSDTTNSGDTVVFLPTYDVFETYQCDSFMQDCPVGEKCVPYSSDGSSWDATKCVPVLGDQAPGEPCTYAGTVEATDDCDAIGMCWDVMEIDGESVGTCTPFCTGTADTPECPEGSSCISSGSGVINLCISSCDPILQDCHDGVACHWTNTDFSCVTPIEDIPVGEPCGFINDCVAGSGCMATEELPSCAGSACCSPWCDLDLGDQPCEVLPGTACVPFFEQGMAPPGYDHIGMCLMP